MPNARDLYLNQLQPKFDKKLDDPPTFRAVITNSLGATDTGSFWKDENARLVYFRPWAAGALNWAYCNVLEPDLGLGVLIQFNKYINQYEVIDDDPIQRSSNSNRRSYRAITNQDLLKGGRFQLWLDPTMFIPLSIYPTGTDTVNVVSGDYILGGERLTFAGAVNQDISTSRPAVGFHRFVGFYLDDTATLGTIDGNTVATGTDALEPSWPAGVLRVGVVDVDDSTAISINDIDNRKVIYTEDDETGALNVWPRAGEVNIDYVSYAAWALAIDALAANEQVIIGEGTYISDSERIDIDSSILGSGIDVSILSTTTKDYVLRLAKGDIILENFTVSNTYSAVIYGDYFGAYIDEDANITVYQVKFVVTGSGANINYGTYFGSSGHHKFVDCVWQVSNGSANYAIYMDAQGLYSGAVVDLYDPDIAGDVHNEDGTLNIYGGKIDGNLSCGATATINLYNFPYITGTVCSTINGYYIDSNGKIQPPAGAWPPPGDVYRWDVSTSLVILEADLPTAVANAAIGDVIVVGIGDYELTSQLSITNNITITSVPKDGHNADYVTYVYGDVTGGLISIDAEVTLVNLFTENDTTTGAGHAIVVNNGIAHIQNCRVSGNSADDVADGIRLDATSGDAILHLYDSLVECSPSTTGYPVNLAVHSSNLQAYIHSSATLDGSGGTADINVVSGGEAYLYNPTLVTNIFVGAGTYSGWFIGGDGELVGVGSSDIKPQESTQGLNTRFERLFGDDVPASSTYYQLNPFYTTSGDQLGFESSANPFVPSGNFSQSNTGVPQWFYTDHHHLVLGTTATSTISLTWTNATAKEYYEILGMMNPTPVAANSLIELRFWTVQAPGAADNYVSFRWLYDITNFPDWPYRIELWHGTGVTFTPGNGTQLLSLPYLSFNAQLYRQRCWNGSTRASSYVASVISPATFFVPIYLDDNTGAIPFSTRFKTATLYLHSGFNRAYIDHIALS